MNDPVLTLFAVLLAALLVTGGFGCIWPNRMRAVVGLLAGAQAGLGAMLALLVLVLPGTTATLTLTVGLPGAPLSLAVDPLSGGFLLLISIAATAAIMFSTETHTAGRTDPTPVLAIAFAGLLLAVLAGDGITLAFGLALGGGAIWTASRDDAAGPNIAFLAVVLASAAAVIVALGLLTPEGGALRFAAARAGPADTTRATLAVLVAIAGLGALLGLVPLHAWLVPAHRTLPAPAAALLSGALLPTALYALLRIVLDLGRAADPLAGSIPLLLAGAATVLWGGWRAARADELDSAAAYGSLRQSGMIATGLGLAIVGHTTDLPDLTALALAAVLLLAAMQAVCGTLTALTAGAIRQQAGTRRLDRLGGLIHRMPVSTAGLLAGLGGLTGLPPTPGFAVLFLLFQAVLAGPRGTGLGHSLLLAALVLLLALGSVLATITLVRLVGMVCLGRPRMPRAAAADEIPPAARPALLVPVALTCLLGLLPGPLVRLLAGGAIRDLSGAMLAEHIGWMTLAPGATLPGYAPVPVALLLAVGAGGALWWRRRHTRSDMRTAPVWQDGFASAPPWLPFGDPATQWNGAVFLPAGPGRPRPSAWLVRARRRVTAPALALIAAGLLLALLAWPGRP